MDPPNREESEMNTLTVGQSFKAIDARMEIEEQHRPRNLRMYVAVTHQNLKRNFVDEDLARDKYLRLAAYKYVVRFRGPEDSFPQKMRQTYNRFGTLSVPQLRGLCNCLVRELKEQGYQVPLPPGTLITEENEAEIEDYCQAARDAYDHEQDVLRDCIYDAEIEDRAAQAEEEF